MSTQDQCPSTKGTKPATGGTTRAATMNGRPAWKSLEEVAGTPEFVEFVEREFPKGASELLGGSRRDFMKLMGASAALAGAATLPGCRRPERHIMAYSSEVPEEIIPGKALYYATSMPLPGGGAEGLLVETHEGRPTKFEGNPLHPINRGRASVWSQAAVLPLYDPDRLKNPVYTTPGKGAQDATWDDFAAWSREHFAGYDQTRGRGLAFVVDKKTSPTRDAMKRQIMDRWPEAQWVSWDAAQRGGAVEGTKAAFGRASRVHHDLSKAECVVSFDADFVNEGPDALRLARDFAATRRVEHGKDAMSRLYVLESSPTPTGGMADHRIRETPSRIGVYAAAVAQRIAPSAVRGLDIPDHDTAIVDAIVEDLRGAGGDGVAIAGPSQPAAVHAICHAINAALGARPAVSPMGEDESADSIAQLGALAGKIDEGVITTLVCLDTNPVFDAPGSMDFASKFASIGTTVTWSVQSSETAHASTWSLNGAHFLESWGDAEAYDGTVSPVQPMIAPLYDPAMSDIETLAIIAGDENPEGYQLVRAAWARRLGQTTDSEAFDRSWRRALQDGVLVGTAAQTEPARVNSAGVQRLARGLSFPALATQDAMEVVFKTGMAGDGRWANCGWLQELPDPASKVVWDNPACVSPMTAKNLGLLPDSSLQDEFNPYTKRQIPRAKLASLTVDGRTMEVPVWILPGMPDNTVMLHLGYGRTHAGLVGNGVGVNTYDVRPASLGAATAGASLARSSGTYTIVSTQNHWSLEGRDTILRSLDKKWWDAHAGKHADPVADPIYGAKYAESDLNIAEQLGELSHTPENLSAYVNPQNQSRSDPAPGSEFSTGPQWGMTIDMSTCSGCGVCTIACQSENNIPIVGKQEVAKGREMQWIRVDRYFTGDDLNNPSAMLNQPVACVHCENAPCETVCPVNATVHGPEGTNNMAYNRCIGTRYCANNCPYKVRRFNFFEWGYHKYNGDFYGEKLLGGEDGLDQKSFNKNFIPPRLREKLDEIERMKLNPDVTVRSRGVMEKCTYCIQRVNEARSEVKVRGIWKQGQDISMGEGYEAPIPDGFFQTACQQACPTESIVFGDILNPSSNVTRWRNNERSYMVLGYLNTRPRTTHLVRIDNPNQGLLEHLYPEEYKRRFAHDPLDHGGGHGGGHGDDSHGEGHTEDAHGFFYDRSKTIDDTGYAGSLRVLASNGAHA